MFSKEEKKMKVLLLNGSPHAQGSTYTALHEMEKIFAENGIETEMVHVGNKDIRGCIAYKSCRSTGKCVFDDPVNEIAAKFEQCDGLVVASPVYYASPNATVIALMDRLFYSTRFNNKGCIANFHNDAVNNCQSERNFKNHLTSFSLFTFNLKTSSNRRKVRNYNVHTYTSP